MKALAVSLALLHLIACQPSVDTKSAAPSNRKVVAGEWVGRYEVEYPSNPKWCSLSLFDDGTFSAGFWQGEMAYFDGCGQALHVGSAAGCWVASGGRVELSMERKGREMPFSLNRTVIEESERGFVLVTEEITMPIEWTSKVASYR